MDIKIEIKEEDPLSDDVTSQNETELFIRNVVLLADVEIKREAAFPAFYSKNEREFLPEDRKKYNSDHEVDNKIEIKEEPWWLETEAVCDDIMEMVCSHRQHVLTQNIEVEDMLTMGANCLPKRIQDRDFTPVKSPRLSTEAVSGDSSGKSPLPSAEDLMKDTVIYNGKDYPECGSQKGHVKEIRPVEERVHSGQSGKCSDGGNICTTLYLKQKNFTHKGKRPHKCDQCGKSFTRLSSLKLHNLIHEGKRPHKCKICERRFTRLSDLKMHNLIHEGKKPHKCEICEKSFTQLSYLKIHTLIHEGKKPHQCKVCEKSFTELSNLRRHSLIHEGIKPHKCKICEKSFTQFSDLKKHNLIHEGKKPHKCEICERSFSRLSHLKEHNLIHDGKKPHKCKTCEKRFTQLSTLKKHNLTHQQ